MSSSIRESARHPTSVDVNKFYKIGHKLGSGSFSIVYFCEKISDKSPFAIKAIDKKNVEKKMDLVETEIKIMRMISHPNIVALFEVFESLTHIYLILEYITGGELFDKIVQLKHYDESAASSIVKQLLSAIEHLHSRGIVHRDLKPENLLLASSSSDSEIKLADFGLSALLPKDQSKLTKAVGTPGYIAPEIILTLDQVLDGYREQVDIWSVGVIMYILLCGFPPFYGKDDDETFDLIIEGKYRYPSPHWDHVSKDAIQMIDKLLVVSPQKRLTATEALQEPWIVMKNAQSNLAETQKSLKEFNELRKMKSAINLTMASNIWMKKSGIPNRSEKLKLSQKEYLK